MKDIKYFKAFCGMTPTGWKKLSAKTKLDLKALYADRQNFQCICGEYPKINNDWLWTGEHWEHTHQGGVVIACINNFK
jgi:hypothetical protein